MEITTKVLVEFLTKFKMAGPQQITECIMKFEEDGLRINASTSAGQALMVVWLKKGAFKTYESIGKIGVNDLDNVVKVLKKFGALITISKSGNLLTVKSGGKKVDIELVAEQFIEIKEKEAPDLKFQEKFSIEAKKLHEFIKDFTDIPSNKDATFTITTAEGAVKFENTGKYKFLNTMESKDCKGEAKAKFGEPFVDGVMALNGNLTISLSTDYPALIEEITDLSEIKVIIAPRIEDK